MSSKTNSEAFANPHFITYKVSQKKCIIRICAGLLNFSRYMHAARLVHISFYRWDPQARMEYKSFLYDTRKPRYKQNYMGYQIFRIWYKKISWHLVLFWSMLNSSKYEHFKGDILRDIWSSTPFLYYIREPKYKQNNMGLPISRN